VSFEIRQGHTLDLLRAMPTDSVHCVCSSPPYWGLRDYKIEPQIWNDPGNCEHHFTDEEIATEVGRGNWAQAVNGRGEAQGDIAAFREPIRATQSRGFCACGAWRGQLGMEPTPELFIAHITDIFREVRRVLRPDGTCWINIGDSYAAHPGQRKTTDKAGPKQQTNTASPQTPSRCVDGLKAKDLVGIPWMMAFALRADGWYLRSEIIWQKINPMPESVRDRPTKAHEQIFLLSKSSKYWYDADAIKERAGDDTHARYARGRSDDHKWADGGPGNQSIAKSFAHMANRERVRAAGVNPKCAEPGSGIKQNSSFSAAVKDIVEYRNKRDVWPMASMPTPEAHFATFPLELPETCILAGCPPDGLVLDPFSGAGTTGLAALKHGRSFLGLELNPEYIAIAHSRLNKRMPLFA